jgi:hypothetical protein
VDHQTWSDNYDRAFRRDDSKCPDDAVTFCGEGCDSCGWCSECCSCKRPVEANIDDGGVVHLNFTDGAKEHVASMSLDVFKALRKTAP